MPGPSSTRAIEPGELLLPLSPIVPLKVVETPVEGVKVRTDELPALLLMTLPP